MANAPLKILLTGLPGCGKTTVVMRILEKLEAIRAAGFFTEEIRQAGRRIGFSWKRLDGTKGVLAHIDIKSGFKVGRYGVDVDGFDRNVVPILDSSRNDADLFVIDEIGKMECLSRKFVETVGRLFASDKSVLATIALKGSSFINEAKKTAGIELITITERNRDSAVEQVIKKLSI